MKFRKHNKPEVEVTPVDSCYYNTNKITITMHIQTVHRKSYASNDGNTFAALL